MGFFCGIWNTMFFLFGGLSSLNCLFSGAIRGKLAVSLRVRSLLSWFARSVWATDSSPGIFWGECLYWIYRIHIHNQYHSLQMNVIPQGASPANILKKGQALISEEWTWSILASLATSSHASVISTLLASIPQKLTSPLKIAVGRRSFPFEQFSFYGTFVSFRGWKSSEINHHSHRYSIFLEKEDDDSSTVSKFHRKCTPASFPYFSSLRPHLFSINPVSLESFHMFWTVFSFQSSIYFHIYPSTHVNSIKL